jgi:hypothetical protein
MKYLFFFMIVASVGCYSLSTKADDTAPGTRVASTASTSGINKGTDIILKLTGGNNAGTYEVTSNESTCSEGLSGEKSFGNQYSETGKGDKELSAVQMIAEDYDEAKKGTSNFNVQFSFGSLVNGTSYNLDPRKNMGTGKLTITESGRAKIATIEGKTKEGVDIKAVVTCRTIQKMINGELKEQ